MRTLAMLACHILISRMSAVAVTLSFGTAALAEQTFQELQLIGTTGECGSSLTLTHPPGGEATLAHPELRAEVDAAHQRVRRMCAVRMALDVPSGFTATITPPRVGGSFTLGGVARGNISMRFAEIGSGGVDLFRRLDGSEDSGSINETFPETGKLQSGCGLKIELETILDLTLRLTQEPPTPEDVVPHQAIGVLTLENTIFPPIVYRRCVPRD